MKLTFDKTNLALIIALFSMFNMMYAQEEVIEEEETIAAKLSFSGSADTYFRTNLSGGSNTFEEVVGDGLMATNAPATSFANLPGFALGMINLVAAYEGKNAGVVADMVFGPRGSDAVFDSPRYSNSGSIVNQLYAYWNFTDNITITMGNFNTFLGYEVISPTANFNYSTSYMFSYGPFSHTGLKLDISTESGFSAMAGILNPTDITEFNPDNDYFFGAQLGYGGFYLNGLFGDEYAQIDLTGGIDVSNDLYLGINATITDAAGDDGFYGVALYAQYATSEDIKFGVRYEFFNDNEGNIALASGIQDTNVSDFTFTANYSIGNLTIIPELRLDIVSEDIFIDKDGEAGGSLSSFVLAFIYGF